MSAKNLISILRFIKSKFKSLKDSEAKMMKTATNYKPQKSIKIGNARTVEALKSFEPICKHGSEEILVPSDEQF